MDILVTGGQGQLGLELAAASWPPDTRIHTPPREQLDLSSANSVRAFFAAGAFDAVINAAAYTAVDRAETEIGAAFAANALGPALLAEATRATQTPLIHFSTDYVFDGSKTCAYTEDDPVRPLNVYGASKEAGEQAVRTGNPRSVILRTAWVVSPHRQNFVKTMLKLGAERRALRVVDDQHGCPTSAADLAGAAAAVALRMIGDSSAPTGIYHFVNAGDTTWCGLARHVFAAAGGNVPTPSIEPIGTAQFPTPARRPANSRLCTARLSEAFGIVPRSWQTAIDDIMDTLLSARVRHQEEHV